MKKTVLIIMILLLGAFSVTAQEGNESRGFFGMGATAGAYYNSVLAGLNIWNFRMGASVDCMFRIIDLVSVGAETGIVIGMRKDNIFDADFSGRYLDIPLRVTGSFFLSDLLLQAYAGPIFTSDTPLVGGTASSISFATNMEFGARAGFGPNSFIFAELGAIMGQQMIVHCGLGFRLGFFS